MILRRCESIQKVCTDFIKSFVNSVDFFEFLDGYILGPWPGTQGLFAVHCYSITFLSIS